ncbi:MAG: DUF3943 domain-containing protein [Deltaproteobacteria bacterium]|nr:DUF3943 domain-containing protein [Deltaproteobacteria bacterium]
MAPVVPTPKVAAETYATKHPDPTPPPSRSRSLKSDHAWAKAIAGEMAIMVAGDLTYYKIFGPYSRWLDKWDEDAWKKRFDPKTFKFDANEHEINAGGHVIGGWAYFLVQELAFRSRDKAKKRELLDEVIHELRGFGFTFATSAFWELFVEEGAPSLNDQIVTPIAGYSGGKAIARFIGYLLDGEDLPHTFEAGVSVFDDGSASVHGHAEIIDGRRSSELRIDAAFDRGGLKSGNVFTKTHIAGAGFMTGGLRLWGGVSSAYDYTRVEARGVEPVDKFAVVEIINATGDAEYTRGRFRAHAQLDLGLLDFGMAQGLAWDEEKGVRDSSLKTKPTLEKFGYAFYGGNTIRPALTLGFGGLEISGRATYHTLDSIEGQSRSQAGIVDDTDLKDTALTLELGASYRYDHFKFSAGYKGRWRSGTAGTSSDTHSTSAFGLGFDYVF